MQGNGGGSIAQEAFSLLELIFNVLVNFDAAGITNNRCLDKEVEPSLCLSNYDLPNSSTETSDYVATEALQCHAENNSV